ncbi:unnamed protein product, partial [marine sediment metagenome]
FKTLIVNLNSILKGNRYLKRSIHNVYTWEYSV